jgi:Ca2+-binding EF-hand superfamily protein
MHSAAAHISLNLQRDSLRFAEADADGNLDLTFSEFVKMQPAEVRTRFDEETLRGWFEAADTDGDGVVSVNEFLLWSLAKEAGRNGGHERIRALFSRQDRNGSGMVDLREFQAICDGIGFGAVAQEVFRDLDDDHSGYVNYHELLDNLAGVGGLHRSLTTFSENEPAPPRRPSDRLGTPLSPLSSRPGLDRVTTVQSKLFLMALSWRDHEEESRMLGARRLDEGPRHRTSALVAAPLDATDATGLAEQIREQIRNSGLAVADAVELFNYSGAVGAHGDEKASS